METIEQIQEKRRKTVEFGDIDIYDFEGTLDEAIAQLENLRPSEDDGYINLRVTVDTNFYDDDDGYAILTVKGDRLETDIELQARIDAHNQAELQKYIREQEKIATEKAQYIELKQKYEKELG